MFFFWSGRAYLLNKMILRYCSLFYDESVVALIKYFILINIGINMKGVSNESAYLSFIEIWGFPYNQKGRKATFLKKLGLFVFDDLLVELFRKCIERGR